jgi:phage terminase large subunit
MMDRIPQARRWPIYADCARPETISYLSRKGYNISGSPKWQGSIEDGIEYIKSFDRIYIHPRCEETINEFQRYSYKVDKHTQQILPVTVDAWNHYCDALRYSLADYIKHEVSILDVL